MVMIVLIMDGVPANHLLKLIVRRLIAQWLVTSHPANSNLLFLRSQIVECDSIRSQASNETHNVQLNFYFVRALLQKFVELCKLPIIFSAAAAVAQHEAEIQKVNKLREFQNSLIEFICFEMSFFVIFQLDVCLLLF